MLNVTSQRRYLAASRAVSVARIGVAALLAGCVTNAFRSEQEQLRFWTRDVSAGPVDAAQPSRPFLVPTRLCADVCLTDAFNCTEASSLLAAECFVQDASGAAELVEPNCIDVVAVGEGIWSFAPKACEAEEEVFADRVVVRGVAPEDVSAELVFPLEVWFQRKFADDEKHSSIPGGGMPEGVVPDPGEPVRVIADSTAWLSARLFEPATGRSVIWSNTDSRVELVSDRATPPEIVAVGPFDVAARFASGDTGSMWLIHGEERWKAGEYVVVDLRDARSLEVVAVLDEWTSDETGHHQTVDGARAILRDGDGRPLFGAPVTWGMRGGPRLEVLVGADDFVPDTSYVELDDDCDPPWTRFGPRSAILQARSGRLGDDLEVEWDYGQDPEVDTELDPSWRMPRECVGPLRGCGCAATGGASWAWGLLAVLTAHRRRRGHAGIVAVPGQRSRLPSPVKERRRCDNERR